MPDERFLKKRSFLLAELHGQNGDPAQLAFFTVFFSVGFAT